MKRSLIPSLVVLLAGVAAFALPPGTVDEISARIEPFGSVCRAGEDCGVAAKGPKSGTLSGQQVYDQFCVVCHQNDSVGAPVFGDVAAWEPRIAKGMDALMASTLNGINAMPPKGACVSCSDDELNSAVTYMIEQAQ